MAWSTPFGAWSCPRRSAARFSSGARPAGAAGSTSPSWASLGTVAIVAAHRGLRRAMGALGMRRPGPKVQTPRSPRRSSCNCSTRSALTAATLRGPRTVPSSAP
eukprot:3638554-Lingulodinium_polyedra.AAC.1